MHTIKADEKCEHITGDWSGFFYVSYFVTTDDEGTVAKAHTSLKTGKSITCSVENCILISICILIFVTFGCCHIDIYKKTFFIKHLKTKFLYQSENFKTKIRYQKQCLKNAFLRFLTFCILISLTLLRKRTLRLMKLYSYFRLHIYMYICSQ